MDKTALPKPCSHDKEHIQGNSSARWGQEFTDQMSVSPDFFLPIGGMDEGHVTRWSSQRDLTLPQEKWAGRNWSALRTNVVFSSIPKGSSLHVDLLSQTPLSPFVWKDDAWGKTVTLVPLKEIALTSCGFIGGVLMSGPVQTSTFLGMVLFLESPATSWLRIQTCCFEHAPTWLMKQPVGDWALMVLCLLGTRESSVGQCCLIVFLFVW